VTAPVLGELPYDHEALEVTQLREAGNGWKRSGLVLAAAPPEEHHTFVVWTWYINPDGSTGVEQGDYCDTLEQAREMYASRGGEL
jgi:hypothetical protein